MQQQMSDQRVAVLVDVQNLYHSARVLYNRRVNYKHVLATAVADRKLIRAIAYGISTAEGGEEKFFEALEKTGFEVRTKALQIFADGTRKGDWDVGIAIDAIKLAQRVDVVVLVSGDGDYAPLVRYIQNSTGCRMEGMAFGKSASSSLLDELDQFIDLSSDTRRFLLPRSM